MKLRSNLLPIGLILFLGTMHIFPQNLTSSQLIDVLEEKNINEQTLQAFRTHAEIVKKLDIKPILLYKLIEYNSYVLVLKEDLIRPDSGGIENLTRTITIIPLKTDKVLDISVVINVNHNRDGITRYYGVTFATLKNEKWLHPKIMVDDVELQFERKMERDDVTLYKYGHTFIADIDMPTTLTIDGVEYRLIE